MKTEAWDEFHAAVLSALLENELTRSQRRWVPFDGRIIVFWSRRYWASRLPVCGADDDYRLALYAGKERGKPCVRLGGRLTSFATKS